MTVVSSVLSSNVTWSSSVEANIIRILDYRIKVFDAITLKRVRQYNRITSASLSIGNLKRNRTYIVFIQARNEVGYGKSANISATTLLDGTTNHSHSFYLNICAPWFYFSFSFYNIGNWWFLRPCVSELFFLEWLWIGNFAPHLRTVKTGEKSCQNQTSYRVR